MIDPDSFVYTFIFDLGKFFPFEISLLGGRFYASYSQKVPLIDDEFISKFKVFLQEQLSLANSINQPGISDPHHKNIEWISAFIEYELVNTEYRQLQKKYLEPDGQKTFVLHLFNIFFDIIFFESITLAKKIDTFLYRIDQLPALFDRILENFSNLSLSSLLDLYHISSTFSDYFSFLEAYITSLNINLLENPSYLLKKEAIINYFNTFKVKITSILKNYSFSDFDLNLRKEIFFKNLEYVINSSQAIENFNIGHIQSYKEKFFSDLLSSLQPSVFWDQSVLELLQISKKTKLSSNTLEQIYQSYYDEILEKFIVQYKLKDKQNLITYTIPVESISMGFNSIFISSPKLKRNSNSKLLLSKENSFLGTVVVTILTEIIPASIFLEQQINSSYIYSVLRFPETEKSIKMFLLYIYLKLELTNSKEIQAACLLQLLTFLELSLLDLKLIYDQSFDRNVLLQSIMHSCAKNEMESELLVDNLLFLPGFYYTSFFLFNKFCDLFDNLIKKDSIEQSLQKIFSLLEQNYGAPPKIILQEIEKITQTSYF